MVIYNWRYPMNYMRRLPFEKKAAALFMLFFAAAAFFFTEGRRGVYQAYDTGTRSVIIGMDPYHPADPRDSQLPPPPRYLCSPTFAYFFSPFSTHHGLGPETGAYVWVMLNFGVFLAGAWSLFSHIDRGQKLLRKKWFILALFLLAGEMPASIMNAQNNGLISGMMMMGAALYLRGYTWWAALLLAMGTNFKLYPLAMALLLGLDLGAVFILGYAAIAAALFFLPLPIMGSAPYGSMLGSWFDIVVNDPLQTAYLGLEPALLHYGSPIAPAEFTFFTLANAGALALASFHLLKKNRGEFIRLIIPALLGFIVLFNRQAESHSFIIIAPVFVFMLHAALRCKKEGDENGFRANIIFIVMGWMLIWWGYSALSSPIFRVTAEVWRFKTLGAVLLYLWSWARIVMHFAGKMQAEGTVIPVADAAR